MSELVVKSLRLQLESVIGSRDEARMKVAELEYDLAGQVDTLGALELERDCLQDRVADLERDLWRECQKSASYQDQGLAWRSLYYEERYKPKFSYEGTTSDWWCKPLDLKMNCVLRNDGWGEWVVTELSTGCELLRCTAGAQVWVFLEERSKHINPMIDYVMEIPS